MKFTLADNISNNTPLRACLRDYIKYREAPYVADYMSGEGGKKEGKRNGCVSRDTLRIGNGKTKGEILAELSDAWPT